MLTRTHLLMPSFQKHHLDIQTPALASLNMFSANNECTQELFFSPKHPSFRATFCLHQLFSISQLHEKLRHSNRFSEHDLYTPCPPPSAFLLLALVALGGTQEPLGPQGVGLHWRLRPRGLGSHVLTISLSPL